jgi:hypothetical protein
METRMMEGAKIAGALGFLAIARLLSFVWAVIKVAAFFAIVLGGVYIIAENERGDFFRNWLVFTAMVVFVRTATTARVVRPISEKIEHVRLGVVAIGNYLQIGVETDAMRDIREKGMKQHFIRALLFGKSYDDGLTSQPMRNGKRVTLADDLREVLGL